MWRPRKARSTLCGARSAPHRPSRDRPCVGPSLRTAGLGFFAVSTVTSRTAPGLVYNRQNGSQAPQRTDRAHDARKYARQRRAIARRVPLGMPPQDDHERRPMARSRAGADVRAADGLVRIERPCLPRRGHIKAGAAAAREPDRGAVVAVRRPAAGHRMTEDDQQNQNPRGPLFALAAMVVIFVLGLLVFKTLYTSRRLEDCFLSGRTNCAPIESPAQ